MSRALVISGGGSKGAFAVGAIKRLLGQFPHLTFDMFVGTSTGSLIIPLAALNNIALLETIYTTKTTEDIVLQNRIGDRIGSTSIFDSSPLWQLLVANYTDEKYAELLATGKQLFITSTDLQTGDLVVFTTAANAAATNKYDVKKLVNADHFRKAVMASASQPVFMQPVKVNKDVPGEANDQFVDGGVKTYAGIQMAIDNGATEIFVIILSPEIKDTAPAAYTTLLPILEKTIDIFTSGVGKNDVVGAEQYNKALQYIAAVKTNMLQGGITQAQIDNLFDTGAVANPFKDKVPLKIFIIRPNEDLGGGPGGLTFDPVQSVIMLQSGEHAAEDLIASLDPGDITWA